MATLGDLVLGKVTIGERGSISPARGLLAGSLVIIGAALVALLVIRPINDVFPDKPDTATVFVGAIFGILLIVPPALYLLWRRREAQPGTLGLVVLTTVAALLVSVYLYRASFFILFPADILIWSETDFVNDILKFRLGYPIFSAQQNNESYTYPPGAQLLTYLLAWLSGNALSIPVYRIIQVIFDLISAAVAFQCCRRLWEMSVQKGRRVDIRLLGAFWLPVLFLIATNYLTNTFVHFLHNDALAQLVSMVGYWLLLEYAFNRDSRLLAPMAIIPAIGFMVKQNLAVWALFYCVQLAVFDQPRSLTRLLWFAVASFGALATVVAAGYLIWREDFIYWIFIVLIKHSVSPLRSFDHGVQVWPYFVLGLLGGAALLRGKNFKIMVGPWLIWLAFMMITVWTSGFNGMLNHIGPATLIAGVWFLASVGRIWPVGLRAGAPPRILRSWIHAGIAVGILVFVFAGMGVKRIPVKTFGDGPYNYVAAIENEFAGQRAEDILLDVGTWVYVRDGVVMKDRASTIGERGISETGDFSGTIQRLTQKRYAKILVRNLHKPDLWYDFGSWRRPSGIKQAMLENYHETGRISPPPGQNGYGFGEISILLPNSE